MQWRDQPAVPQNVFTFLDRLYHWKICKPKLQLKRNQVLGMSIVHRSFIVCPYASVILALGQMYSEATAERTKRFCLGCFPWWGLSQAGRRYENKPYAWTPMIMQWKTNTGTIGDTRSQISGWFSDVTECSFIDKNPRALHVTCKKGGEEVVVRSCVVVVQGKAHTRGKRSAHSITKTRQAKTPSGLALLRNSRKSNCSRSIYPAAALTVCMKLRWTWASRSGRSWGRSSLFETCESKCRRAKL